MDSWKYFDITHRNHVVCNPTSLAKFSHLVDLLQLPEGGRVLEIATGKGEFITQLAERYGVNGVALDLSPYCVADAMQKLQERAPNAEITVLEMDGAHFQATEPFLLTACIGASWVFDGHAGTLQALAGMTIPGGWIVVGEPYWRREPDSAYLEVAELEATAFGTHAENVETGESLGLLLEYAAVSNEDEWDVYEGLQWHAAERYATAHPDDPDVPELLQRARQNKRTYLHWGRDTLGWALYLFRKP